MGVKGELTSNTHMLHQSITTAAIGYTHSKNKKLLVLGVKIQLAVGVINNMKQHHTIEIFSANCPLCKHITDDIEIGKCKVVIKLFIM